MRISEGKLVVEGKTEALAISAVLQEIDAKSNRGKLQQQSEHTFTCLALEFEPPLPIERLSTARLTGRRALDLVRKGEPREEYVLSGLGRIRLFGEVLGLGLMPKNLFSSGPRLGKKRYLRDNRVAELYSYLRDTEQEVS